ncbi:uncharacterized protein LOC119007092 isoform X5 [Acanthopagrus latus]|uniref:uncharacterized protein LOC119007092 isoform X5 n=1 Tax=Acanthopagrus latus TaxID=8177 RepID=UPI00187C25CC|nr:uncharacterized protein LOC119007092 isoform X5 [Acanthopagrus latus]
MILLWFTLLVLHRGYTLVPVTTVELGEPATFSCDFPNDLISRRSIQWYKQSAGDLLKLIVTRQKSTQPEYAPGFSNSRFQVNSDDNFCNLTILRTRRDDEGTYHCAVSEWIIKTVWSGTYLLLKGNSQRTLNYTVVQQPTASDPVRPGDLKTLQCSVLSDSETKTCPGDHSVFWFRVGSDKSHPNILYTDGNRRDECEDRSDTQKSCVHHFSKKVSSSDAGTYYCAVATCGEILFGNGAKVETECPRMNSEFIALVMAIICFVISLIGNIVFICCRISRPKCEQVKESTASEAKRVVSTQPVYDITESGDDLNYAALHLSGRRATSGRKKNEVETEESVYSQVKR